MTTELECSKFQLQQPLSRQ